MKNYICFEQNGKIIKTGVCPDKDLHLQGENVIEGIANDATQYIANGKVVDMPPRPSVWHEFDYTEKQWVQNRIIAENNIRSERNTLLTQSDWTQLPDVPISTKAAWAKYRQDLRDITAQSGYPFNVIWPEKPE